VLCADVLEAEALQESGVASRREKTPQSWSKQQSRGSQFWKKKGNLSQNDLFFLGLAQAMLGDVDSCDRVAGDRRLAGMQTRPSVSKHIRNWGSVHF